MLGNTTDRRLSHLQLPRIVDEDQRKLKTKLRDATLSVDSQGLLRHLSRCSLLSPLSLLPSTTQLDTTTVLCNPRSGLPCDLSTSAKTQLWLTTTRRAWGFHHRGQAKREERPHCAQPKSKPLIPVTEAESQFARGLPLGFE